MRQITHGGDVYRHPSVIDFSSNMNPLGTPRAVIEAGCAAMERISNYPDVRQEALLAALAAFEGVEPGSLILGNGAAELIFLWAGAIKAGEAMILAPTFAEYQQALEAAGSGVHYYNLKEEKGFALDPEILSHIDGDLDALILCNPNNPTGRLAAPELLLDILDKCQECQVSVLVDECFLDFCDEGEKRSLKPFLKDYPNLFILKAFTKRYAMAGLRLGYGMTSDEELLSRMEKLVQPWNVSLPAQEAGLAALKETAYVEEARALIREERSFLKEKLAELGFTVLDGQANYICFHGETGLCEAVLADGILIRDCSNYKVLSPGWYRIAVRTHEENLKLLEALRTWQKQL